MSAESIAAPPLESPPPHPLAAPVPGKSVSKLRWSIHLALMAAVPLVAGFAGLLSHAEGPALTHTVRGLLTVCAFEAAFVAVPLGLAWLASRATRDDLLLRWRPGPWVLPLGAVYSIVIRICVAVVMAVAIVIVMVSTGASGAHVQEFVVSHRPQVEKLVDINALSENSTYFWLSVVLVSFVIGGLREELWRSSFLAGLRSIWPKAFASTRGGIAAAGVAALFFGAAHYPQGVLAAGMISVIGFLLGSIMVLHRSVWPSVVAHGLFDAASVALLPWAMRHMNG